MPASWVDGADGSGFGLDHLPYGATPTGCVARIGDFCINLAQALDDDAFAAPSLNGFMSKGPRAWREARERLRDVLTGRPRPELLTPVDQMELLLPWRPADYVDFFAAEAHATNLGRMFRPDSDPLLPNWRNLPVGYHGRSSTLLVSGAPVYRPRGLTVRPGDDRPALRASALLDVEVELGLVLGVGNERGHPIPVDRAWDHIFGFVLVNDWSARDIQSYEYQPLGPHLGKSFATSVSAWITPAAAIRDRLVDGPPQEVADYLAVDGPRVPDIDLSLSLNGTVLSRPRARDLYWGPAQLLAHATVNGAAARTGDLYASGTISGWDRSTFGSLIELTWRGRDRLDLDDGTTRAFLEDGDVVVIRGSYGNGEDELGEVMGRIEAMPD